MTRLSDEKGPISFNLFLSGVIFFFLLRYSYLPPPHPQSPLHPCLWFSKLSQNICAMTFRVDTLI